MSLHRRIVTTALCVLACAAALARGVAPTTVDNGGADSVSSTETLNSESSVRPQVYPAAQLSTLFPAATQISFAVAVVPDPLVPRYRRPYDLDIVALELGMLRDGYVLDRFFLPWNDELRAASSGSDTHSSQQLPLAQLEQPSMGYRYGLMIFRCDGWRSRKELDPTHSTGPNGTGSVCNAPVGESATGGARIRAIYIVTDTATKGIESEALLCAIDRINSQLRPAGPGGKTPTQRFAGCWRWPQAAKSPAPRSALLSYPDACHSPEPAATLLVLGPDFSGAVDSAGEVGDRMRIAVGKDLAVQPIKAMCLLSSSATDSTNTLANDTWGDAPFPVKYASLALDNNTKLRYVAHLLPVLIGSGAAEDSLRAAESVAAADSMPAAHAKRTAPPPRPVAILAEASTYGYGVCGYAGDRAHSMPSEVRNLCLSARHLYFPANIADIRYGTQQDQQRRALENPLKLQMPSGHLSLDLGAENGSEYPESRQSAVTSAGVELALDRVLDQLQEDPPKLVIVIATDVRDRLFLFDELRKRLARAMLIDLASDNLLGHPDFLHASRGALTTGSAELTAQGIWSTDFQVILADTVACLYDPGSGRGSVPCDAASLQSGQPVLQIVSLEGLKSIGRKPSDPQQSGPDREMLAGAELSAPFFCLGAAWLLIGPLVLPQRRLRRPARAAFLTDSVASGLCLLYPIAAFVVARSLHLRDHDNLVFLVTVIVLSAALVGLVVCVRRLRQATRTAAPTNLGNSVVPVLLALSAACFATIPSLWYASFIHSAADYLDVSGLEAIALDPDPGLAFLLLVALATLVLLYGCVVLATSAGIVNRNSAVLREDRAVVAMPINQLKPVASPGGAMSLGPATEPALTVAFTSAVGPAYTVQPQPAAPSSPAQPSSTARGLPAIDPQLPHRRDLRGTLNLNPLGLFAAGALIIGVIVVPDLLWGDVRLTVFGPFASRVALLGLTATSVCATVLLACSLGMARRISAISRYLATARKQYSNNVLHEGADKSPPDARATSEDTVGRWPADVNGPRVFPPTPVVARAADGGVAAKQLLRVADLGEWRQRISEWIHHGRNDGAHRAAIFALLATEISVFRWCLLGAVLCAFASMIAVYLFPIEADPLLIFNLLLFVGVGAVAGLAATTFERDELLSKVLCNRHAPRKFSTVLFVFASVPFLALALGCGIAQVPGVVDWGGGILQLLGALGLHP